MVSSEFPEYAEKKLDKPPSVSDHHSLYTMFRSLTVS
jgi:hypothetical protein